MRSSDKGKAGGVLSGLLWWKKVRKKLKRLACESVCVASFLSLFVSPLLPFSLSVFGGRYFLESSVSLLLPRSVFRSRKVYSTWSKACAYRFSHRRVERTTTVRQYAGLVDTEYRKQMEICTQINHARGGSHLGKNGVLSYFRRRWYTCVDGVSCCVLCVCANIARLPCRPGKRLATQRQHICSRGT